MRGNRKLGPRLIWSFSLPAVATCPGASGACKQACYAMQGHYRHASVREKYARNLALATAPDFAETLAEEAARLRVRVLRIHGSGDFFSADYVRAWAEVARRRPGTTFYAYTRSWRVPAIRAALAEFALLPNVQLWYSCDAETGLGPRDGRVRLAWMHAAGADPASVPAGADLAFRVAEDGPAKRLNGVQVCPYEDGVARKAGPILCEKCSICWSSPRKRAATAPPTSE